jgi:DNA invertase Pin-like site-specific DNA recombinase
MNHDETKQTHPLITTDHLRRSAIVYLRQSTEQQVRNNTGSTDFQRNLAPVARSFGWTDAQIEIIDEDLGRSGSSSERRTGWQKLQAKIAAGQVGMVLVATISRLSRQVLDFELFRLLAAAHNTLLYTDGRVIDLADSNDTIVSQMTAMVAHFENRKRTEIMSQARRIKAKQGVVVSTLPVGWIETPGGGYDFDPQVKDNIRVIIDTFLKTRSLRKTVMALEKAGIQIPARHGHQIIFIKPTLNRVRLILLNPAYAGVYVYGKTKSQPGGPVLPNGQSKRMKVPEENWIKNFDHHPGYMTLQQQEEIRSILHENLFARRYRAGRGPALLQGLLRCAICNRSFNVTYRGNKSYSYRCAWEIRRCSRFTSSEFEQYVLAEVFKVLEAPPLEMLKSALEQTRKQEQRELQWIQSERERLAHEERIARERADFTRGSYERVHRDALEKLEKVFEEKERFEQKLAIKFPRAKPDESAEELEELCRIASQVPTLWHHSAVTHQERKEILRCLIDHIVVSATHERIDAIIVWKTGSQTPLALWRGAARKNLVGELHAQGLTVSEIQKRLATGRTSTGQIINMGTKTIYEALHKLGFKPSRYSTSYLSLRRKAADLNREGRSLDWIAQHFNEQGLLSASGKPWAASLVAGLLRTIGKKAESFENTHRRAIEDARVRGLNYDQMAVEFNEKQIRRKKGCRQPWTAKFIEKRWEALQQLHGKREQKELTGREQSEYIVLKKTA